MNSPTFSVVITTYKRPDFLAESLNGVLEQSLPAHEIIVVNDSPEADYSEIVPTLKKANVVYHKNETSKGANYSRNKGIALATGDIVAFLDDDDIWFRDYLTRVNTVYSEDATVVATTCGKRMMHDHSIDKVNHLSRVTADELRRGNTYCGMSGVTVRKDIAKDFEFDETLPNGQDWDFFVRIVQANLHIFNITEPLYYYRVITSSGITQQLAALHPKNASHRLASSLKHKEWLGKKAFDKRVAKQLLEGLSRRKYKISWLTMCIKEIGILPTLKFLFLK